MRTGRLLILGGSGHGKVVGDAAMAAGGWGTLRFFDDRWPSLVACGPWPVVGTGEDFLVEVASGGEAFVAIGNGAVRLAWLRRLKAAGARLATVIHPRAVISPHVGIGEGVLVVAGAVINIDSRLGLGCVVNTSATVDHDCMLGEGSHVCPGAHLAGEVRVGEASWIGIGSSVLQGVCIGNAVTVGAGAVVLADVADGLTVVGVPARPVDQKEEWS